MQPKPFQMNSQQELGNLFREEARWIIGNLIFWLGAMALLACPVWLPLMIEALLNH